MSDIIRSLLPRLPAGAISGDFIDERSIGDMIEKQAGVPSEPTAMVQMRLKAEGKNPTPMVNSIQLDRG